MIRFALAAAVAIFPLAAFAQTQQEMRKVWNRPTAPFTVAGNIHYVGTEGLSAFLITTPAGHVLIDGGSEESAALIAANVARLGFRMSDVRTILINHAHWDHAGGLARLKAMAPRAVLISSVGDGPTLELGRSTERDDLDAFEPVKVDRTIVDGEALTIGGTRLVARLTPGHTPGCTSWTTTTRDPRVAGGRPLSVLFACSLTPAGLKLVENPRYPDAVANFRRTFATLASMKTDVFLTFHPEFFSMTEKRRRQIAGDKAAFVDPGELPKRLAAAKARFEAELARQSKK